jgi:charged multivesicular body protein 3|tara:strand:- start:903 stop:1538 length:636 start_codon:yes stop_codon:yes gene_type:complete
MMLFGGKKLTMKEQTKKWQKNLRKESRLLDRQIRKSNMREKKIQREIKKYAKKGEKSALTILAKDMIKGRKARDRLYTAKAQLNSVSMQLQTQMAMSKVAGALEQSSAVMHAMSNIVKLPQVTDACRTMAQEMMRAGIIQEMTDDMFEMLEPDDMEDEVEEEVAKVVQEIMGVVPVAPNNALHVQQPEVKENEDQVDAQANEMEARLAALA